HDELRKDPLLATLVGKADPTGQNRQYERDRGKPLAGKSTLNRLELTPEDADEKSRYKKIAIQPELVDDFLLEVFIEAQRETPRRLTLDFDATDDPLHGEQEDRFFHGYYREYCYLPLYAFCEGFPLCAKLRPSNIDASKGTVEELKRIVPRLREAWPEVELIVRGDSGFCRDPIMTWCEENKVDYVLGIAKNKRLKEQIAEELEDAKKQYEETGKPSRVYKDFRYQTLETWTRERRVVGKAEQLSKGENPRFVITSLPSEEIAASELYEELYCARGEMENRIKEQQLDLFADRTSTSEFRGNQVRLYFSTVAYVLMHLLRRVGLEGTDLEKAQCGTIRLKLLKIGAQVRVTFRKVWISMASGYPYMDLFAEVYRKLRALTPLPAS
ncbi:MAG: IS1380 family transposase, partial [Nitrospira sp.]|nr:IS1380 family transposase [Nitrospira sp.]